MVEEHRIEGLADFNLIETEKTQSELLSERLKESFDINTLYRRDKSEI